MTDDPGWNPQFFNSTNLNFVVIIFIQHIVQHLHRHDSNLGNHPVYNACPADVNTLSLVFQYGPRLVINGRVDDPQTQ